MSGIKYYFGKLIQKIQVPTLRNCTIDSTAKVCQRSNLIDVKMGRYSYMGASNSLSNVDIGSFCSIASYCAIGGGSHPTGFVSSSPLFLEGGNIFNKNFSELPFAESEKVTIGNDVWIGEGCFINAGVTIGDGAIVGAHSVVTKDVPSYAVVAGAPVRLIRFRFDEAIIEELLKLQWWDWPDEMLYRFAPFFADPDQLLREVEKCKSGC